MSAAGGLSASVVMALVRQAALAAAVVFFALKAVDVSVLRVRLDRRRWVACVVVVALLHAGPVRRSIGADVSPVLAALPVMAVVPVCLRRSRWRIVRRAVHALYRLLSDAVGCARSLHTRSHSPDFVRRIVRGHQRWLHAPISLRAPPA